MTQEGADTKMDIVHEVNANGTNETLEPVESDGLLDESDGIVRCTIDVGSSAMTDAETDADIPRSISPGKCEIIETKNLSFGSVTTIKSTGRRQLVRARTVLWYFAFTGFAINFMLRVNMNIAITEMVTFNPSRHTVSSNHSQVSECIVNRFVDGNTTIVESNSSSSMIDAISTRPISYTMEQHMLNFVGLDYSPNGNNWNEVQTNRVLGSYFWLHWLTQIPGGILAKRYGTKLVFGVANFTVAALCFLVPIAAYWNINALIALRVIQGLFAGVQWPSMHHLAAHWIPPDERSSFITSYLGSAVGVALFSPIFGYMLSMMPWQWVFYLSGLIGSVWYVGWLYFVYDTPAQHPRIDPHERHYIEKSLEGNVHHDRKGSVPWKAILLSGPLWSNIVCFWGSTWAIYTLMTQTATYFRIIHGWDMQWIGWLSGIPHILRMGFAYFLSTWSDSMLRQKKMSLGSVRKLACALCTSIGSIIYIVLAISGCNAWLAAICVALAIMLHGASTTGPLTGFMDISPNYSGITLGVGQAVTVIPGILSPYIVGILTLNNQTVQQWQYVFLITFAMMMSCGLYYQFFGSVELQSWNQPKEKSGAKCEGSGKSGGADQIVGEMMKEKSVKVLK